jgi:hypothetical protein
MFVTITKIIRGQDALSSPYIPPISFQRATAEASFKDSVLREDMWTLNPNKVPSFFISAWAWKYEFMIDRSKDELLKTVRWGEITNFTCIPVIFKRNLCKFTASASSLLICSGHLADSLHVCELAASFVEEIQLIHFEYMYASLFLSRFTWSKASLNGGFMSVSCTLNTAPHQQNFTFCMKPLGERSKEFHHGETFGHSFTCVENCVKPPLRHK